jgi:hypothetical protein
MTLPKDDLFIVNRNKSNYSVDFDNLKQYIPGLPAGSRCVFFMQSAPLGWTADNTAKVTESTVRVVNVGGGSGGTKNFSDIFKTWNTSVPTHNHGISAGNHTHGGSMTHSHTHRDPLHGHSAGGFGAPHNHPVTGPSGSAGGNYGGGPNARLKGWSWQGDKQVNSGVSDGGGGGGTPLSGKTGVSVNNASPSISYTTSKASSLKTTNTTGNVGDTFDFTIKYHKSIICQKDIY